MILRISTRFRTALILGLCAVLLSGTVMPLHGAQGVERDSVEALLADRFATLAMLMVAGNADLNDDRLTGSRLLLEMALELSPRDAELWRLRRELAQRMGDREAERKALSTYCRLRPDDDVAQADLILMSLDSQQPQTLQHKAATVERLINSDLGKSLTPALRSRLASYVAVAAQEVGNTTLLHSWLRYALRTDPTNVVAARMTYSLVMERNASPFDIAVAINGLLRANPVEASTHQRLGELLLTYGVYEQAAEQFQIAQSLAQQPGSPGFYHSWALALTATNRTKDALQLLEAYEQALAAAAKPQTDQPAGSAAGQQNATTGDAAAAQAQPRPSVDVALPAEMRMLRLTIQTGLTNPVGAELQTLRDEMQAQIDAGSRLAKAQLAWMLAWFNADLETAQRLTDEMAAEHSEEDVSVRRLRGWLALHRGEHERAASYLQPLAEFDAFAAYGMARLTSTTDTTRAVRWRRRTVQLEPASLAGMLAARELVQAGEQPEMTEVSQGLLQMMRNWPVTLLRPDPVRRPWVGLTITTDAQRPSYLDPIIAKVSIRNMTDMPLSFAPEGGLPTQLFVYISTRQAGRPLGSLPPIIVDVHRRLRLEPNESIEIEVPLHRGPFGVALRQLAGQALTFSATAVLDPRQSPRGHVMNGPLGATASLNLVEVTGVNPSLPQIERWLAALDQADRAARGHALAHLVQVAAPLAKAEGGAEISQRIVTKVNQLFPQLDPVTQAWAVIFLPGDPDGRALFDRIHQVAQRSDEAVVRVAYTMAQVTDPQSTHISTDMRHADPRISIFARVKRHLLLEQQQQQTPANQDK